jgi:hypothetical protein
LPRGFHRRILATRHGRSQHRVPHAEHRSLNVREVAVDGAR